MDVKTYKTLATTIADAISELSPLVGETAHELIAVLVDRYSPTGSTKTEEDVFAVLDKFSEATTLSPEVTRLCSSLMMLSFTLGPLEK